MEKSPLNLTTKSKKDIVLQVWLKSICLLVILIAGIFYLNFWLNRSLDYAKQTNIKKQKELIEVREQLNKVAVEEQEIINKSKIYISLEKNKITQKPNQLDLQELLFAKAKKNGISEFEYKFAEKWENYIKLKDVIGLSDEKNNEKKETVDKQPVVSILPQSVKFLVHHELQLFNFLQNLILDIDDTEVNKNNPKSLTKINSCKIERINPDISLSPTKSNFSAICEMQWINIVNSDYYE